MSNEPLKTTDLPIGDPGSPERSLFDAAYRRQYSPCETGLHVCGIDDEADLPCGPHFTVLNIRLTAAGARAAFERAKVEFEVPAAEGEALVDLQIHGSTEDNFFIRRQMVEPMQRSVDNG